MQSLFAQEYFTKLFEIIKLTNYMAPKKYYIVSVIKKVINKEIIISFKETHVLKIYLQCMLLKRT